MSNLDRVKISDIEKRLKLKINNKEQLYDCFLYNTYLNETGDVERLKEKSYLYLIGNSLFNLIKVEYIFKNITTDLKTLNFIDIGSKRCNMEEKIMYNLDLMNYIKTSTNKETKIDIKIDKIVYPILAVVYLENGYEVTRNLIKDTIKKEINCFIENPIYDWKTIIMEYSQHSGMEFKYLVVDEDGLDNNKIFKVNLKVENNQSIGKGKSIKEAERNAAHNYYIFHLSNHDKKEHTVEMIFQKYQTNKKKLSANMIEGPRSIKISNTELLNQCFIHNSYLFENNKSLDESYDNIAYLGTYAKALISDVYIYKNKANIENMFSIGTNKIRNEIMGSEVSIKIFNKMNLDKYIIMGKAARESSGIVDSIRSDITRALLGAIFLTEQSLDNEFIKTYENNVGEYIKTMSFNEIENIDYISELYEIMGLFKWRLIYERLDLKSSHNKRENEIIAKIYINTGVNNIYIHQLKADSYKLARRNVAKEVLKDFKRCIIDSLLDNKLQRYTTNLKNVDNSIKDEVIKNFLELMQRMPEIIDLIPKISSTNLAEIIRINPKAAKYVNNSSLETQLELLYRDRDGLLIRFIKSPNVLLQIEAVKQNWEAIQYIEEPNLEIQLEAVKENSLAIKYINNTLSYEDMMSLMNLRSKSLITEEIAINIIKKYIEGSKKEITVNSYERNSRAREACIKYHGSICKVCGFDFGKIYGEDFSGKIHVHHIIPLSEIDGEYEINPIKDMIPVCPNCHMVIHSKPGGTYSIEEIKRFL